jgi:hypothetical protein
MSWPCWCCWQRARYSMTRSCCSRTRTRRCSPPRRSTPPRVPTTDRYAAPARGASRPLAYDDSCARLCRTLRTVSSPVTRGGWSTAVHGLPCRPPAATGHAIARTHTCVIPSQAARQRNQHRRSLRAKRSDSIKSDQKRSCQGTQRLRLREHSLWLLVRSVALCASGLCGGATAVWREGPRPDGAAFALAWSLAAVLATGASDPTLMLVLQRGRPHDEHRHVPTSGEPSAPGS